MTSDTTDTQTVTPFDEDATDTVRIDGTAYDVLDYEYTIHCHYDEDGEFAFSLLDGHVTVPRGDDTVMEALDAGVSGSTVEFTTPAGETFAADAVSLVDIDADLYDLIGDGYGATNTLTFRGRHAGPLGTLDASGPD